MRKFYKLASGKLHPCGEEEAQVAVIVNPDQEQRKFLIQEEEIDEHTMYSALDMDELARLEVEDDHVAIIFKKPKSYTADDQFQFKVGSFGIFLFKDFIIILSDTELPLVDERRFSKIPSIKTLALRLLHYSIYHFNEHLKIINRVSEELEAKINLSMKNEYLLYMFGLGKGLVYYLNAINSNDLLLKKMQMSRAIQWDEDERELLEDCSIENQQCLRQAEIYSNILSSMVGARAGIVSNNLNILMKTLNIITVGLMVPTFVVSAFSMNVEIPMQKLSYAFWVIMGLASLSVGGFLWVMKAKKW